MRKFGLIGFPIIKSFSQNFFTEKFAKEGITDAEYNLYPIKNIEGVEQVLADPEIEGLNVTIPHKEAVIPYLDFISPEVKEIGACNCIKIIEGKLHGYNTDAHGFLYSIQPLIEPHHSKALILGDGGAAKAVKYVLGHLNIAYRSVTRKPIQGNLLFSELAADHIKEYSIIINTTPLGTFPDIDQCPDIPYDFISSGHLLYDLVYNPPETLFLKKGKEKGASIKNGMQMLELQAEANWKIWNQ